MRRYDPSAALLVLAALAAPCRAQGASAPRFELAADTVLVDERVGIALSGLPAGGAVTVRLSGPAGWHAAARFRADDRGRVDLASAAPDSGDYSGVHAMGLFWSAQRDSAVPPPPAGPWRTPDVRRPPPQPWVLAAVVNGGVVAADTVWRLAMASGVRVVPVRERGLVGVAYYPPDEAPHPAVIVLGGSEGGIPPPTASPGGLASRGYVVLALGYFAAEGLPGRLANIPLEYFGAAIRWLAERPAVDSTRIGVLGTSRGGELSLLLGATYPALRAVVAYVPSHVLWPGTLTDAGLAPAWTLGGRALPYMDRPPRPRDVARHAGCPAAPTCAAPLTRHRFLAMLDDRAAEARAEIPVERISGAVLLISGRDDGVWPSSIMADRVVARLRRHQFRYPVEHLSYERAGHSIGRPFAATSNVARSRPHPITGRMITPGGTPEGTARASEDSWPRVLAFLEANLRGRP